MRRFIALLLVLINVAQLGTASAQDDAHTVTVANWTFDVTAAVVAPYFMDTVHLGTLDDGRVWLVVKMTATNTADKKLKIHSDDIQLNSDGKAIKQTGDESEALADELNAMSIGGTVPHEIAAGKVFDVIQVFKIEPDAASNTLVFDFSGTWEVGLDDLIAASAGDPHFLVDGTAGSKTGASSQSPWSVETASYRITLIGAATAATFSGPFHLGKLEDGQNWVVVTYQLSNLRSKDTEVKADNQRLLVGEDELKQATDETKSVASELDLSLLTLKLEANETQNLVQVFKVPATATDYTLQISARGKLFINLTPLVQLAAGDANAVVPGSSLDLAQVETGDASIHAAPTAAPTNTPAPTSTKAPTSTPAPTDTPNPTETSAPTEESGEAVGSVATETSTVTTQQDVSAAQTNSGDALSGRLGGSLADVQTRFGVPSWTDTGLIGYNSVPLAGTDAILVVYYDANQIVTKISVVYQDRPAVFDDASAIPAVVTEVTPLDGICDVKDGQILASSDQVDCLSDALTTVTEGDIGFYHFAVDPTEDEYFEIIIQDGRSDEETADAAPAATESSNSNASGDSTGALTDGEQAYVNEVVRQTKTMADSLDRFSTLTVGADITDMVSQDWILSVAVELAIWHQTYQDALALTPPPRFAAAHAKYLEGLKYISDSADAFAYGVDNFDTASIEQATNLMNLGNQSILEAIDEIQALQD